MLFEQELWWLLSPPPPSVSIVPWLRSLWCVQPEVSCQKTLMSEEGRRGEGSGCVRRKGRARKGPEENPSFSRLELNLTNLTQLPLMLQSPSLISLPFLSLYLLPLIFSLSAHFSMPLTHIWAASHTLRLQLGKIPVSRVVSIWHRASRPLRHSPLPPHPALLVTWDNWGRNPDRKTGSGSRSKLRTGDERMFLKLYFPKRKE